jgi:hypothetical protein
MQNSVKTLLLLSLYLQFVIWLLMQPTKIKNRVIIIIIIIIIIIMSFLCYLRK